MERAKLRALVIVAVGVFGSQAVHAEAQALPEGNFVKRDRAKLSAEFRDAPLDQAVALLEKEARIVVRVPPSMSSRRVTVSFKDLPLERGMKRFLRSASLDDHAVLYEPGPQGRVVFLVFDKATGAPAASAAPPVMVAAPAPPPTEDGEPPAEGDAVAAANPPPPAPAVPAADAAAIAAADAKAAAAPLPSGATPWGRRPMP